MTDIVPEMTIELPSMKESLAKIRDAFDNKTLQMFDPEQSDGKYAGPCAIGVLLTKEQRDYADTNELAVYSADDMFRYGIFAHKTSTEEAELHALQVLHDNALWVHNEDREEGIVKFEERLVELERKYNAN